MSHEQIGNTGLSNTERGSVLPLMSFALTLMLLVTLLLVSLSGRVRDRAQAQSAADSAALAGVVDGEASARSFAAENGAELVSFSMIGNEVEVVVVFMGVTASASAERRLGIDRG